MPQVSTLLAQVVSQLSSVSDTPELDARVLLANILDKPRTWLTAHPETPLTRSQLATVKKAVSRLEAGEPLPYVLGHWEFFGLDLEISADVLIPRPETELMVERAIAWLMAAQERRTIADVGTGSGCIAVAIAKHIPDVKIFATDISRPALEVARRNARRQDVAKRIDFIQCDLLPSHPDPLPTDLHFDLICANLPYIPTRTLHKLPVYGREPRLALDGGADGLDIVRRLLEITPEWLAPNGMILLEIEATQGMAVVSLAYDAFDSAEIHLHKDLAGQDRLVEIML
ncbi:MAG: peptide chain release factor N(5)-glutamine methyltransferase [Anaerolineales bacterium]|nr:peptide chain release factor N(5)-glutamine methyltransferase [Anaerolineales bacterium]